MIQMQEFAPLRCCIELAAYGVQQGDLAYCWWKLADEREPVEGITQRFEAGEDAGNYQLTYYRNVRAMNLPATTFPAPSCSDLGQILHRIHNIVPFETRFCERWSWFANASAPELRVFGKVFKINAKFVIGGDTVVNQNFWSSTEAMTRAAFLIALLVNESIPISYVNEIWSCNGSN